MTPRPRVALLVLPLLALVSTFALGCESEPSAPLAPTASALAPAKPAAQSAKKLVVDKAGSKVELMMDAPQEKIRGKLPGSAEGELHVDASDLSKTTGLIRLDLSGLELVQDVADDTGKFTGEKKSDLQNQHARAWLEIGPDAPEADRKKNAQVEFSITKVDAPVKDVTKLTGAERKATFTASGELLLHGRKAPKTVEMEGTFFFEGDKLTKVSVKTAKPFVVGLAEHDVKPREGFGKLAQKTLEILAPKVAKDALVTVELSASAAP
jgi:hypothetical protein